MPASFGEEVPGECAGGVSEDCLSGGVGDAHAISGIGEGVGVVVDEADMVGDAGIIVDVGA